LTSLCIIFSGFFLHNPHCIPAHHPVHRKPPKSRPRSPNSRQISLSVYALPCGIQSALCQAMEREPQTDYELQLWSKAVQMEGIILPLIDSLKVSVDLLVRAGNASPDDEMIVRAVDRFRRVIAAGERAAEGLGIEP